MQTRLATVALFGFVLMAAAACGGGGGDGIGTADPDAPTLTLTDLAAGKIVPAGTYRIDASDASEAFLEALDKVEPPVGGYAPGAAITVADLGLRCTSDSASNCFVTVNKDGSFTTKGTIATVSAGDDFPMTPVEKQIAKLEKRADDAEAETKKAEDDAAAAAAAAAAAKKKADDDAAAAKKKADDAVAAAKKKAEDDAAAALKKAEDDAAEAQRKAKQAQEEAARRIEEAETQADASARARALIGASSGAGVLSTNPLTVKSGMSVAHMSGERLTFSRPSALPAKGSAPSVPGSWRSASYSGPRGSVGTDTAYLYTNIQAPGSKAFWKVHGESVADTATGFETIAKPSGFGTTAKELYPGSDGPDGETTNSGVNKAKSIGGTYDGYSGRFECKSECDIAANDEGALTFHGDWTFTASSTAKRTSKQAKQDSEFLYFGIWAFEPTNPDAPPHEFNWAAGGDAVGDLSNFGDLRGEATFTGGAIGKYALAKATGRGARAAKTGTFTATANFTAVFGGATNSTISGRLTGFKEGGTDLGSDWNIFLGGSASTPAALTATGVAAGADAVASGAIDGDDATGAWAATLHGSDNPGAESLRRIDPSKYPASRYPDADVAGVAGWFNAAAGTNAAIAGAFGAACRTGTMCAK